MSTPNLSLLKCSNVEASDYTEIVISTFKRFVEISILNWIGVYYSSIR